MSGSRYSTRSKGGVDDTILSDYPNERKPRKTRNKPRKATLDKSSSEENLEAHVTGETTPVDSTTRSNSYPQLSGTSTSNISINELTLRLENEQIETKNQESEEINSETTEVENISDADTDFFELPSKSVSKSRIEEPLPLENIGESQIEEISSSKSFSKTQIEKTLSSESTNKTRFEGPLADSEISQISVINKFFSLHRSPLINSQNPSSQKNHSTPINKQKSPPKGFLYRVRQTINPFFSTLIKNKENKSPKRSTFSRSFSSFSSPSYHSFRRSQETSSKTLMDDIQVVDQVNTGLGGNQGTPNPVDPRVEIKFVEEIKNKGTTKSPSKDEKEQKIKLIKNEFPKIPEFSIKSADKNQPIMVPNNQCVSLRDALAVVPEYDGESTSLTAFIQGCEEARAMLEPGSEKNLAKAIRAKIKGEPRRTISLVQFDTVFELYDYLKDIYSPAKNMYQLQGELGTSYQKKDESVIGYANRLRDTAQQILEAYEYERDRAADDAFMEDTEKSVVSCFLHGLKPEIEQRLANAGDISMDDLVKKAVKIEKHLSARGALRGEGSGSRGNKNENKRQVNVVTAEESVCQICKRTGHRADTCTYNKQHNPQAPPNPTRKDDEKNIPTCQACNKIGHTADKCFKLFPQTNNKPSDGSSITICQVCNKRGHTADRCFKLFPPEIKEQKIITCQICKNSGHTALECSRLPQKSQLTQQAQVPNSLRYQHPPIIKCQICKKDGHTAHICPYRNAQSQPLNQNTGRDRRTYAEATGEPTDLNRGACHYCKQPGHFIRECQVRINNEFRGAGMPGNAKGLPGMGATGGPALEGHPMRAVSATSRPGDQEL